MYVEGNPVNFIDPSGLNPNCQHIWKSFCAFQRLEEISLQFHGAEALFRLFEDDELSNSWGDYAGRTTSQRLEWVLMATKGDKDPDNRFALFTPVHFAIDFCGNSGFFKEFRDDQFYPQWGLAPSESNQVGHFLTAVDIAYYYWDTGFIIGHEQYSDTKVINLFSYLLVGAADFKHWYKAVDYDAEGNANARDQELWALLHFDGHPNVDPAYVDSRRQGNSLQDLRLSLKGYRFAKWVKENANWPARAAGSWLRSNLSENYYRGST